jgi:hypothetical protein
MEKELQLLREQLAKHEVRLKNLENALIVQSEKVRPEEQLKKKLSLMEFLREVKPQNTVQKVLSIGYYLEKHEKLLSFNINDIRRAFRMAKEPLPSNVAAFVNQNIHNVHIMQDDKKKENMKAYVVTSSGENIVDSHFGSEGPKENK